MYTYSTFILLYVRTYTDVVDQLKTVVVDVDVDGEGVVDDDIDDDDDDDVDVNGDVDGDVDGSQLTRSRDWLDYQPLGGGWWPTVAHCGPVLVPTV